VLFVCITVYSVCILLVYVCMCVLFRWLAPDGVILPDVAQLFVAGMDDKQYLGEQTKLWGNRRMGPGDGFALKPVLNAVIKHPRVDNCSRSQLVTDTQQLLSLDLYTARLQVRRRCLVGGCVPLYGCSCYIGCEPAANIYFVGYQGGADSHRLATHSAIRRTCLHIACLARLSHLAHPSHCCR
jgi:hypothetical protein